MDTSNNASYIYIFMSQISIRELILKTLDWKSVYNLSITCKDICLLKIHYDMIPLIIWPIKKVNSFDVIKENVNI
jgi:hypothetical protein